MFADKALNGVFDGALYGNPGQLGHRRRSRCWRAIVYSGVVSFILLKLIGLVDAAARDARRTRPTGLDITLHGEEAYLHAEGGSARM